MHELTAEQRQMADRLDAMALNEYEAHLGKIIVTTALEGYVGDNSVNIDIPEGVRVRVTRTEKCDIVRWIDDWLDPAWNVEPVEAHPKLESVRSLWIYGTSRRLDGSEQRGRFQLHEPGLFDEDITPA